MPGGREIESLSFPTCETKGNLRRAGSPPPPPLGQAPRFPGAHIIRLAPIGAARWRRAKQGGTNSFFIASPMLTHSAARALPLRPDSCPPSLARTLCGSAWPRDGLRRRIAVRPSRPRRGVPPHSRSRNDPCSRLHEHHVTHEQREFSSSPYSALPGASATTGLRPRVRREIFFCLGSSRQT